jgi:hypothetical protein
VFPSQDSNSGAIWGYTGKLSYPPGEDLLSGDLCLPIGKRPYLSAAEFACSLTRPTHGFYEPYLYGLHRQEVTFVQGTGEEDPDDNTLGTFDPMYPLSQSFFGMHGLIDRRNLISTSINSDLIVTPKLMMRLSAFDMRRAETADGVYRTNGTIQREPSGSNARHIGFQTP